MGSRADSRPRLHIKELGDVLGRSRWHAQGEGYARPQARRRFASHAGRRNKLPGRQSRSGRSPQTRGDLQIRADRPPGARSRRRDDGSGQADDISAERR